MFKNTRIPKYYHISKSVRVLSTKKEKTTALMYKNIIHLFTCLFLLLEMVDLKQVGDG